MAGNLTLTPNLEAAVMAGNLTLTPNLPNLEENTAVSPVIAADRLST